MKIIKNQKYNIVKNIKLEQIIYQKILVIINVYMNYVNMNV